ncbi:MAG: amino acid ABC transporter substrate-binding protein [Ruminococcaceae bacterium]|nr:amino acid ABC transporter substrate-binding protein [Oscillospiraceae bacterium]
MKATKKILAITLVLVMTALCFASCGKKNDVWKTTEDGKVILEIGFTGPLTGEYANYGISVRDGAKLAVEEINAKGGVNGFELKLLEADSGGSGEKAVQGYGKLIDDGMKVSLGGTLSGENKDIVAAAKNDGLLILTPSASALDSIGEPNAFRLCFNDPQQGEIAANTIKNKNLATKVAILYDNGNDYCVGNVDTFKTKAAALGITIVTEQTYTESTNTDFTTQLTAIKNSGAELVFFPIYAADAAKILRQAAQMSLDIEWFGADGLDGLIEKCGDNVADAEGVLLLTPFYADSQEGVAKTFVDAYKAKYGKTPDQFAADAYDCIYTIVAALTKGGLNADNVVTMSIEDFNAKMIAAMTQIEVTGATGTMKWTADGETVKEPMILKIVNGKTVVVD